MADFETTIDPNDCRVWGWGLANIDTCETVWDVTLGNSLESFLDAIKVTNSICYFHNLAFDAAFILDHIMKDGYSHKKKYPRKGEFTTLISNMGAFYSVTVVWDNGKKTEFRDSFKKLPMSVSRIASSYGFEEAKGEINFKTPRPRGHVLTREERSYIARDILIPAKALKIALDEGATRLTVGSDAITEFKKIISTKKFSAMFPVLDDKTDMEIRGAYRGGYTYVAERFKGKRLGCGKVFDVNSLYPYVMYSQLLPYGEPIYVDGKPEPTKQYPLFITSITFTAKLRKKHLPVIQIKGSHRFTSTEYQTEITDPVTMMVSSVDLELWEKHYHLDIHSYDGAWMFKGNRGVFQEYIDKWIQVKINAKGGKRELAKLFLNSLYGKFATNPIMTGKYPVLIDGVVKLVTGEEEIGDPVYTAMGVFITAYARTVTITAAQKSYDTFVYCDTDSLHMLGTETPQGLHVDPDALGAWKHEYDFDEGLFIRAKTYIEKKAFKGYPFAVQYETHIAGLPVKVAEKLTFETMVPEARFPDKLVPKRVPGGIVLVDVGFKLPSW